MKRHQALGYLNRTGFQLTLLTNNLVPEYGIEPSSIGYQPIALPLSYSSIMVAPRGFDPHAANPTCIATVLQTAVRKGNHLFSVLAGNYPQ